MPVSLGMSRLRLRVPNRDVDAGNRFHDDTPAAAFIGLCHATLERWLLAYCPVEGSLIPVLPDADARKIKVPALVFRSGASDAHHTRETTERVAGLLPTSKLVEPPWGDREWIERGQSAQKGGALFERWHLLVPMLADWAAANIKN